ncbi:hydrolase 76 protein, partial [Borealophlyctis nickersoniae]
GVLDYSKYTGDKQFDNVAGTALANASFNQVGDLLGGSMRSFQEKTLGKWNDDIGWWALSS